jgi:hypothetical protein
MKPPPTQSHAASDLAAALKQAAAVPVSENLAAVLRHMPEKLLRSEIGRRSAMRRKDFSGGDWRTHRPGFKACRCPVCNANRTGKSRHLHRPLKTLGTRRLDPIRDKHEPGCFDSGCPRANHTINTCRCGALGVECSRFPYTKWHPKEVK